jgi:hypothetical protein
VGEWWCVVVSVGWVVDSQKLEEKEIGVWREGSRWTEEGGEGEEREGGGEREDRGRRERGEREELGRIERGEREERGAHERKESSGGKQNARGLRLFRGEGGGED